MRQETSGKPEIKKAALRQLLNWSCERLLELVDENRQTALEVGGLVDVNDVVLGQFVQHGHHTGQHFSSFFPAGQGAQFAHRVAGGLMVITVAQTLGVVAADALEG